MKWEEPRAAITKDGKIIIANVILSASEEDCINMMRVNEKYTILTDQELLDQFIVINWAWY